MRPLMMENDLNGCKRCGQCMSVCPVYQATFREADVARGKLALLECVEAGSMSASERLEEILSRCLLCGACAHVCANRVETNLIMQSSREQLFEAGNKGESRSAIFSAVREDRLSAKVLLKGGALLQALACKKIPETSGLHLRFPLSFSLKGAQFLPLRGAHFCTLLDLNRPSKEKDHGSDSLWAAVPTTSSRTQGGHLCVS